MGCLGAACRCGLHARAVQLPCGPLCWCVARGGWGQLGACACVSSGDFFVRVRLQRMCDNGGCTHDSVEGCQALVAAQAGRRRRRGRGVARASSAHYQRERAIHRHALAERGQVDLERMSRGSRERRSGEPKRLLDNNDEQADVAFDSDDQKKPQKESQETVCLFQFCFLI